MKLGPAMSSLHPSLSYFQTIATTCDDVCLEWKMEYFVWGLVTLMVLVTE